MSPSRHKKMLRLCCPAKATGSKNAKIMVVMVGTMMKILKRMNSLISHRSEVKENIFVHVELCITTCSTCHLMIQVFNCLLMLIKIAQGWGELIWHHRNIFCHDRFEEHPHKHLTQLGKGRERWQKNPVFQNSPNQILQCLNMLMFVYCKTESCKTNAV